MAIEISKLRSWLSLIVSGSENNDIEPLPNLEFNFVAANSLLSLEAGDLFTDEQVEIDLQNLRDKYFSESEGANKKRIQEKYLKLTHQDLFDERSNQLRTFNPFDSDSVAQFFDPEIMFGVSQGFDVVVGNPPYIGEKGHKGIFSSVRNSDLGVRFYQGKMDYFYFFFHLGLDLLKPEGILCLITTNYYVTATYASKLVDDIKLRTSPRLFLNFNEIRLFESATGQHNLISLLQKEGPPEKCVIVNALPSISGKVSPEALNEVLKFNPEYTTEIEKTPSELFDLSQIRLMSSASSKENDAIELMAISGLQLGQAYEIRQGVLTGADRVSNSHVKSHPHLKDCVGSGIFIVTPEELAALDLNEHELEIIKPFFKNSAIHRYIVDTENKYWVIYADKKENSLSSRAKLREHLMKYEPIIAKSSDNSPYLHRPRNFNFDSECIVVPQRSSKNTFALAEHPFYSSADVYFIGSRLESPYSLAALTGMLNSSLYYKWLYFRGKRKGEYLELFQVPLTQLPLPKPTKKNLDLAKSIEAKVQAIRVILSSESGGSIDELEEQISTEVQKMFEA
jgi:adenine-specific DNA-methyltransferase